MNRVTKSVLGASAALTLSVGGLSTASATGGGGGSEYPNTETNVVNLKVTLPKGKEGGPCKDAIKVHIKEKITVTNHSEKRATVVYHDGAKAKFHNPRTDKRYTATGGSVAKAYYGKTDTRIKARGASVLLGEGVSGIVYIQGKVHFTIYNDGTDKSYTSIHSVKGKYIEICKKLGTKPAYHQRVQG